MRTLSTEAKNVAITSAFAVMLLIAGCAKKPTAPPPPPPPPPAAPTASISANPSSIQRGESTRLTWRTENATDVSIDGIGPVDANGSRDVSPTDSTTYRLVATGAGGTQDSSARVTVTAPPPPPPAPTDAEPSLTDTQWVTQNVRDVLFDYDSAAIRPDQQSVIQANAKALQGRANLNITIEGHADERGSTEYNLALGDERANAVKNALVAAGVSANRINVISYGKEKPVCTESDESCWQRNRRGHAIPR